MKKANRLSRRPDWKVCIEKNNENQIFIKDCWLCSLHKVVIEGLETDIVEKIKNARGKDKEVVRVEENRSESSEGRGVADRRIFSAKRRKCICAKE